MARLLLGSRVGQLRGERVQDSWCKGRSGQAAGGRRPGEPEQRAGESLLLGHLRDPPSAVLNQTRRPAAHLKRGELEPLPQAAVAS